MDCDILGYLAGTEVKPEPGESKNWKDDLKNWQVCNAYAVCILNHTVPESLLWWIMRYRTAHECFTSLATRFGDHTPIVVKKAVEVPHASCKP